MGLSGLAAGLSGLRETVDNMRGSQRLILVIVFLALLLDNMLLTVVVPIIPDYLITLEEIDGAPPLPPPPPDTTASSDTYWNHSIYNSSHYEHWLFNISLFNWTDVTSQQLINENSRVGWLFSSKAIVQLIANPFVGPLTTRYGHSMPMFTGFGILLLSTLLYAFGESYTVLFIARAVHGISSSCTAIAGMTMLAQTYTEDKERSRAMGIALGGLALGVLIGYPFGGFSYQFWGKMTPFLVISCLAVLEGVLQLWVLQPTIEKQPVVTQGTPLHRLLADPYILLVSGAILFPEMAMAMLESTLPLWLIETMHPKEWQLGTVFLPDSLGYWAGCNVFGVVAHRLGRWSCTICALLLMGICLICIPLATQITHLIVPHLGLGLALGIVDASMMPLLALLVETRHSAVYGSVYAIAQVSISLAFALGPSVGGQFARLIGFPWLIRGMAIANILYSPLCYFLRQPPSKEENKSILMKDNGAHSSYTQEESFNYQQLQDD